MQEIIQEISGIVRMEITYLEIIQNFTVCLLFMVYFITADFTFLRVQR